MQQLVITAVGPDRAGLVDELTGYLLKAGANVGDSRMVNLHGQFAVILAAEAPDDTADEVRVALPGAGERIGLIVHVASSPPRSGQTDAKAVPFRVKVYAMDQPGIVHQVTHMLRRFEANIEELETHLEPGAYTGTPMFTMQLCMTVPGGVRVSELRRELDELCASLNCDVELNPM
jgi:glycine cleavage system transcriptional repressor